MKGRNIFDLIDSYEDFNTLSKDILNKIDAFVFIFDFDQLKPIWINKFFEKKFKYSNAELEKISTLDFMSMFHPLSLERFTRRMRNYDSVRAGTKTVYQLKAKDGEWINMLLSSRIYQRNPDNSIKLIIGYATEVTREELEEQQKQMDELYSNLPKDPCIECLSRRELDVIRFIAKGFTDREIAEKLHISIHTTKTHRKRILSKLRLKNSAVLIKFAVENGLV